MKDPQPKSSPEDSEGEGEKIDDVESMTEEPPPPKDIPMKRHFSIFERSRKSSSVYSDTEGAPVHVVTRVRPLNSQEIERKDKEAIEFGGKGTMIVDNQSNKTKSFAFDAVFEPQCRQRDVFDNCDIRKLLDMAIDGYACTAFAFGQTGSGKTYTMTGPVTPESTARQQDTNSLRNPENYGLIQYSFAYLMDQLETKDVFNVKASYMEIYNEQVQDLLHPYGYDNVQVRWAKGAGFYVENLFVREIESLDELMDVLEDGMKNRSVTAHNLNEHSSRSHSILTVHIDSEGVEEGVISVTKHGKISFVDLAGSEKVKESGSTGDTLTEATNINRSLLTLGNCISALSDTKKRNGHIPFRDSKLTKLLADSLGGSGATLMIACVSPSSHNVSETLNTLRYAKRAKKIKNKPVVRMDPREQLILKLQREMHLIRQENQFLRNQLQFPQREKPRYPRPEDTRSSDGQQISRFLPQIPQPKANERPATENSLYGMLQEYMVENEALRSQNQSLMTQHSYDEREQRMISRENDRLSEKLEEMQRLVLSSPLVRNGLGNGRTNSGHSYLSLRSFEDSSFTPISQAFGYPQPILGPNGTNYPNYAIGNHGNPPRRVPVAHPAVHQQMQPRAAWENVPNGNTELPPLRRSPPYPRKQPGKVNQTGNNQQEENKSKWDKSRSYAKQLQEKKAWHRINNGHFNHNLTKKQKQANDVMRDFPLRDLSQPRPPQNEQPQQQHPRDSFPPTSFPPQGNRNGFTSPPNNQMVHPRMGKSIHTQGVGVLPREAYEARDVSPRGSMKELSATSLRRMNNKIRREMRDLDTQINNEKRKQRPVPS